MTLLWLQYYTLHILVSDYNFTFVSVSLWFPFSLACKAACFPSLSCVSAVELFTKSTGVCCCLHRRLCVTSMWLRWLQNTCTGKVRLYTCLYTHTLLSPFVASPDLEACGWSIKQIHNLLMKDERKIFSLVKLSPHLWS